MFTRMNVSSVRRSLARGAHWRLGLAAMLVTLLLTTGLSAPASAQSAPPAAPPVPGSAEWMTPPYSPQLISGGTGAGGIYVGAIPPGAANKPVLVFVAGTVVK